MKQLSLMNGNLTQKFVSISCPFAPCSSVNRQKIVKSVKNTDRVMNFLQFLILFVVCFFQIKDEEVSERRMLSTSIY